MAPHEGALDLRPPAACSRASSAAADLALFDDEVARLDEVSATPLLYPYWHQASTPPERMSPADATLLTQKHK